MNLNLKNRLSCGAGGAGCDELGVPDGIDGELGFELECELDSLSRSEREFTESTLLWRFPSGAEAMLEARESPRRQPMSLGCPCFKASSSISLLDITS